MSCVMGGLFARLLYCSTNPNPRLEREARGIRTVGDNLSSHANEILPINAYSRVWWSRNRGDFK